MTSLGKRRSSGARSRNTDVRSGEERTDPARSQAANIEEENDRGRGAKRRVVTCYNDGRHLPFMARFARRERRACGILTHTAKNSLHKLASLLALPTNSAFLRF